MRAWGESYGDKLLEVLMSLLGLSGKYQVIQKLSTRWHGDYQYKLELSSKTYIARIITDQREFNCLPPILLDDSMLQKQLELGSFFRQNNIPFMKNYFDETVFFTFQYDNKRYRFVMHEWIKGNAIRASSAIIANEVGQVIRQMHEVANSFSNQFLVQINGRDEYQERWNQINNNKEDRCQMLDEYLEFAKKAISIGFSSESELYAIHGDLNFSNLILDEEQKRINGVIDFDSIGLSSKINEVSSVIKWYSKDETGHYDYDLAEQVMCGYGGFSEFTKQEKESLKYLAWLRNCLTNRFVKYYLLARKEGKISEIIQQYNKSGLELYKICERLV